MRLLPGAHIFLQRLQSAALLFIIIMPPQPLFQLFSLPEK